MKMSLERSKKEGQISNLRSNTYHSNGENVVKIGPVNPEIALLNGSLKILKKKLMQAEHMWHACRVC